MGRPASEDPLRVPEALRQHSAIRDVGALVTFLYPRLPAVRQALPPALSRLRGGPVPSGGAPPAASPSIASSASTSKSPRPGPNRPTRNRLELHADQALDRVLHSPLTRTRLELRR